MFACGSPAGKLLVGVFCVAASIFSTFGQASVTLAWNAVTTATLPAIAFIRAVPVGHTSSIPTGITPQQTLTNLTVGSNYYFAVTAYSTAGTESDFSTEVSYTPSAVLNPTNSVPASTNPVSTGLPLPWQSRDVGPVSVPGAASGTNNVFTITGTGTFGSTSDSFYFVYQPMSGDGEIIAQISSATNRYSAAVMIRESLTPNSIYTLIGASNGKWLRERRDSTGGSASATSWGNVTGPNAWVRLARTGKTLTRYTSPDGVNWSALDSRTTSMGSQTYIGLAVGSVGATNPASVKFSNIKTTP